jgi:hypothetical protein
MDKVIRYEEQWNALPAVITLQRGECREFPQAVEERDKQICNRFMTGKELLIFPSEAPREFMESKRFMQEFEKRTPPNFTFETLHPDEQKMLAYHHQRIGRIITERQHAVPAVASNQRTRSLLIMPR